MLDYIKEHDVPSDYVRRDDVIDNAGYCVFVGYLLNNAKNGTVKLSDVEEHMVEAVPLTAVTGIAAADVRENVRGRWIKKGHWYCCSECGHDMIFTGTYDDEQIYCSCCGADMRG